MASPSGRKEYSLQGETELRQFLAIARPEWSISKRKGNSVKSGRATVKKVLGKLRDVGVYDCVSLAERIDLNTINEQLAAKGHQRFSREAIEAIKKHTYFIRSLEAADTPFIREVGNFASVPQMLSSKRIVGEQRGMSSSSSCPEGLRTKPRPEQLPFLEKEVAFDCGGELRLRGSENRQRKGKQRRPPVSLDGLFPQMNIAVSDEDLGSAEAGTGSSYELRRRPSDQLPPLRRSFSPGDGDVPDSATPKRRTACDPAMRRSKTISFSLASTLDADDNSEGVDTASFSSGLATTSAPGGASRTKPSMVAASDSRDFTSEGANPNGWGSTTLSTSSHSGIDKTRSTTKEASRSAVGWQATDGVPSYSEAAQLLKTGNSMRNQPMDARWTSKFHKSVAQQGDEMLREQAVLDEKARFLRSAFQDDMRSTIASTIRARLREESLRDVTQGLSIQQHVINIRKQFNHMTAARRELTNARMQMQSVVGDDEDVEHLKADLAELSSAFKVIGKQKVQETASMDGSPGSRRPRTSSPGSPMKKQ